MRALLTLGSVLLLSSACGGDDGSCELGAADACDGSQVCEAVEGAEPACFSPVVIAGRVTDLQSGSAIGGARVVGLDVNGAAQTSVAVSDLDGGYALRVPSTRDEDGVPIGIELTLRVDAASFQTFPAGLRPSLPIDTATAVEGEDSWRVESALTDVGLLALGSGAGSRIISGVVEEPDGGFGGVLVVAESGAGQDAIGYTAVADVQGDFVIFNVPDGPVSVTAYARGVVYDQAQIDGAGDATVELDLTDLATGDVEGNISIVETDGATTVVLAVESTFDAVLERGQTVPGLRAPEAGQSANVTSGYSIAGVPPGRYVVLGAFENDGLVRDPDLSIGGTSLLNIEVSAGSTTTVEGFKINEALAVTSPGKDGAEAVGLTPTLRWEDDSGEKSYDVLVFDAFGAVVWEQTMDGVTGGEPELLYEGPALEDGMYYQFRVTAKNNADVPIARTEDLAGVFYVDASL